jgi:hypothetical protein
VLYVCASGFGFGLGAGKAAAAGAAAGAGFADTRATRRNRIAAKRAMGSSDGLPALNLILKSVDCGKNLDVDIHGEDGIAS